MWELRDTRSKTTATRKMLRAFLREHGVGQRELSRLLGRVGCPLPASWINRLVKGTTARATKSGKPKHVSEEAYERMAAALARVEALLEEERGAGEQSFTVGELSERWRISHRAAYHTLERAGLLGDCQRPNPRLVRLPARLLSRADEWRVEHGRKRVEVD